jgi:hypothetical protein
MRHLLFVVLVTLTLRFFECRSRDEIEKVPDSLIQTMITPVKWKDSRTLMLSNGDMRNPEYYLEDIRTGKRTVCTGTDMPSVPRETDFGLDREAKNPTLSPDGSHVAFTLRNDLYSKELETGNIVRYTYDGSETVLNGWASWVYYEEILGRPADTVLSGVSPTAVTWLSSVATIPGCPCFLFMWPKVSTDTWNAPVIPKREMKTPGSGQESFLLKEAGLYGPILMKRRINILVSLTGLRMEKPFGFNG